MSIPADVMKNKEEIKKYLGFLEKFRQKSLGERLPDLSGWLVETEKKELLEQFKALEKDFLELTSIITELEREISQKSNADFNDRDDPSLERTKKEIQSRLRILLQKGQEFQTKKEQFKKNLRDAGYPPRSSEKKSAAEASQPRRDRKEEIEDDEDPGIAPQITDPYNFSSVEKVIKRLDELGREEGQLAAGYKNMARKAKEHLSTLRKVRSKGREKPSDQDKNRAETYLKSLLSMPGYGVQKDKAIDFFVYLTEEQVAEKYAYAQQVIEEAGLTGTEHITGEFLTSYSQLLNSMLITNPKFKGKARTDSPIIDDHMQHLATMPIICIDGPPGTGKTTVAEAIAKALGMEYAQQEMAAKKEDHIIIGRGVEWASPELGIIAKAQKESGSSRVVILLDEVEKAGPDVIGALTTPLDVGRHGSTDKLLDAPVDKRGIMFILTTNEYANLPVHIRSRTKYLYLGGYDNKTKIKILKKIAGEAFGQVSLPTPDEDVITHFVENYVTKPGVREAKALMYELAAKLAEEVIKKHRTRTQPITIQDVTRILGAPSKYRGALLETWTKIAELNKKMSASQVFVDEKAEKAGKEALDKNELKSLAEFPEKCDKLKTELISLHGFIISTLYEDLKNLEDELTKKKSDRAEIKRINELIQGKKADIESHKSEILSVEIAANNISNKARMLILSSRRTLYEKEPEELLRLLLALPTLKEPQISKCTNLIQHLKGITGDKDLQARVPNFEKILKIRSEISKFLTTERKKFDESEKLEAQEHIKQLLAFLDKAPLSEIAGFDADLQGLLGLLKNYPDVFPEKEYQQYYKEITEQREKILAAKIADKIPKLSEISLSSPATAASSAASAAATAPPAASPSPFSLAASSSSSSSVSSAPLSRPSPSSSSNGPSSAPVSREQRGARPTLQMDSSVGRSLFFKHGVAKQIERNPTLVLTPTSELLTPEVFQEARLALQNKVEEIERESARADRSSTIVQQEEPDTSSFRGLSFDQNPNTVSVRRSLRSTTLSGSVPLSASPFTSEPPSPSSPTPQDVMTITHRKTAVEIEAAKEKPEDDELYAMVLTAKIMAEKIGRTRFTIEHCETNPEAAFKLYLIGKSMGLDPKFKDSPSYRKNATVNGILNSEYGKKTLMTKSRKEETIADIYRKVEGGTLKGADLREYIASLERTDNSPRLNS